MLVATSKLLQVAVYQQNGALPTPKERANHCLLYSVTPYSLAGIKVDVENKKLVSSLSQAIKK